MADLNDTDAARAAVKQIWQRLAPMVTEAKALEDEAEKDPSILDDPWSAAQIRWVWLFNRELGAVQTVAEGTEQGVKLPVDDLRAAYEAGKKLVGIIEAARERVPEAVA